MGDFPRKADGRRIFSAESKLSTAQPGPLAWVRALRLAAVAGLVLVLAVCTGGYGPLPAPEDPGTGSGAPVDSSSTLLVPFDFPATFVVSYLVTFSDLSGGARSSWVCPGTLDLPQRRGSRFSGTFTIAALGGCPHDVSGTVAGEVAEFGEIHFELRVPAAPPNELPGLTDCPYLDAGSGFHGAVNSKRLVANAAAVLACPSVDSGQGRLGLRIRIGGEAAL